VRNDQAAEELLEKDTIGLAELHELILSFSCAPPL
jgi:hypothetical protein